MITYRRILALVSLITGLIFISATAYFIRQDERQHAHERNGELLALRVTYEVHLAELEHNLINLAQMLASEPEVIRLMSSAAQLPRGVDGSINQDALDSLRDGLRTVIDPQWQVMQDQLGIRQLQLTTPDLISLLRQHAPDEHGDSLERVRPMLEAARRDRVAHSGFEIGRAFAGLRGVVPVLAQQPNSTPQLVGLIEIGALLDGHIARLTNSTGVGYGVLLNPAAVSPTMWQAFQPPTSNGDHSCCFLLATSRHELRYWVGSGQLHPVNAPYRIERLHADGRDFDLLRFPLHDFLGQTVASRPPVGALAVWRDVTPALQAQQAARTEKIVSGLLGFLLVQGLILGVARLSRREWQAQLAAQTREVSTLAQRNEVLLMAAEEGIFGIDLEGRTRFINTSALRMLGFRQDEIEGERQHLLFHHSHHDGQPYPEADCPIAKTLKDGVVRRQEDWFTRRDGRGFPVELTCAPLIEDGRLNGAVVVFHDISDNKQREEALIALANTDALTGVANRRHFLERLQAELGRVGRHATQASLLMIDLDHFKRVNDTYGHATGDEVLRNLAALARQTLRQSDVIGRVGGEEFAALLPDDDAASAVQTAERLRKALETHPVITADGVQVMVTASIGVTRLRATDEKPEAPLGRADEALYLAKNQGRNRVVLHPGDQTTQDSD
ncbi:MAG: diguanylate cyclase [Thauera sp.]|nr:diguanylate cyclase [Thauera sp.]MDI3491951.1 diguanylate cyclase [Thauera sp.]